jgi:uncharacterized protein (DUF433 family)
MLGRFASGDKADEIMDDCQLTRDQVTAAFGIRYTRVRTFAPSC